MDIFLALLVGAFFLVLPYTSCEDLAAARTMEEETNLVCGPFLSCQIELMIYPLWQQFSCSHIGCPVMQCTCSQFLSSHFQLFSRLPRVCGCKMIYVVKVLKGEKVLAYEHMRKASDPELSSWTLLIGSCF